MEKNARIYVAGYYGMVGSAIVRNLQKESYSHILGHSSEELNLLGSKMLKTFSGLLGQSTFLSLRQESGGFMQITPIRRILSITIYKFRII
jgi:hypothetical protein